VRAVIDDLFSPDRPRQVLRLGQREFKGYWVAAPALDDHALADQGFALAGQGRVLDHLLPQHFEELIRFLRDGGTINANRAAIGDLLDGAAFVRWIGLCEVDVCTDSEEYLRIGPAAARARTLSLAPAIDAKLHERGLGLPPWFASNENGGLHADLIAPWSVVSVHLVDAARLLVREVADELGIPLLSRLGRAAYLDKRLRPAAYVDDNVLGRGADARGSQWRIVGGCKPGGFPKTPIDIRTGLLLPRHVRNESRDHADPDALWAAIAKLEEQARFEAVGNRVAARVLPNAVAPIDLRAAAAPADQADDDFVRENPLVEKVWNEDRGGDASLRLFWLVRHALEAGADQARVHRLCYAMPWSKCAYDTKTWKPLPKRRPASYVDRTIASAMAAIARRLAGSPPDVLPPDEPPAYAPPPDLRCPALRAWTVDAAAEARKQSRDERAASPEEQLRRATVGALLRAGVAQDLVVDVLRQDLPELAARAAVRTTAQRLLENKPVSSWGRLRSSFGALSLWRLAKALQADLGDAKDAKVSPFLAAAIGAELLPTRDRFFLEDLSRRLPETHPSKRVLLRPGYCCVMHEEKRSNFDGRCVSAKRFVCDSYLCGSCWRRRILAEVRLALEGWGGGEDGSDRVQGWRELGTTFQVHLVRGVADWQAVRRACDEFGKSPGAKLRVIGVDPETGRFTIALVSTFADGIYAASAMGAGHDRRPEAGQVRDQLMDLTADQAAARVLELRASWHVYLRRLVEERRGDDLAAAMAGAKGKHLVSRSRKALTWPPRDALRAALRTSVKIDETDAHDEEAGFHHAVFATKTGTKLHTQDHPHTYDQAVGHLRAHGDRVGRDWTAMVGDDPDPIARDPRAWKDPLIGPARFAVFATLGTAGRAPT
jgi:hypothetical protein